MTDSHCTCTAQSRGVRKTTRVPSGSGDGSAAAWTASRRAERCSGACPTWRSAEVNGLDPDLGQPVAVRQRAHR